VARASNGPPAELTRGPATPERGLRPLSGVEAPDGSEVDRPNGWARASAAALEEQLPVDTNDPADRCSGRPELADRNQVCIEWTPLVMDLAPRPNAFMICR